MSPKDALRLSIGMSDYIINAYINDLDDADLLIRPVPGMNHIAWQLGHLIAAERTFIEMVKPGLVPAAAGRLRRGPHQGDGQARRPLEVPVAGRSIRISGRTQRAATLARTRRGSRVRPGQDRPREIPRVGPDGRRAPGHDRHPRLDALRPVRRRPPPARQTGGDLSRQTRRSRAD